MAFVKEEIKDVKIEDTFSIKHEDTEEQTDLVVPKRETEVKNEMEEEKKDNLHFKIKEESFSCPPTEKEKGKRKRTKTTKSIKSCQKCGCSKANLNMNPHTGEKSYSCKQCAKTFSQHRYIKIHMKPHTGGNPFTCQQCGMSFSQIMHFKNHMETHIKKKPCMCPLCGRICKKHLEDHMRIHTGEKPFACQQCGQRFGRKGVLTKHMKVHFVRSRSHVRPIMPKNPSHIAGVNLFAIDLQRVSQTGNSTQNE